MEISISITSGITPFAESKGWTKTVTTFKESVVEGRVQVEEENPTSAEQFVSDYFKKIVVNEFLSIEIGLINQNFDEQKKVQIEQLKSDLSDSINVQSK